MSPAAHALQRQLDVNIQSCQHLSSGGIHMLSLEHSLKMSIRLSLVLPCALLAGCGSALPGCNITATINPSSATADHLAAVPGNQVQFALASTETGSNCPLAPNNIGSWSTSDPGNTKINAASGLATCLATTSSPAIISNSSTVAGRPFTTATLSCQ